MFHPNRRTFLNVSHINLIYTARRSLLPLTLAQCQADQPTILYTVTSLAQVQEVFTPSRVYHPPGMLVVVGQSAPLAIRQIAEFLLPS
jgi:hypothetical protein